MVMGNPPYLESSQIAYYPRSLATVDSRAVHSMCVERALAVLVPNGGISMILPMALTSTQRMQPTQQLIEAERTTWYLNFGWRPSKLFDTVNRALSIFVARSGADSHYPRLFCTGYQRWTSADRHHLFGKLGLVGISEGQDNYWRPKVSHPIEIDILKKLQQLPCRAERYWLNTAKGTSNCVYYRTTGDLY